MLCRLPAKPAEVNEPSISLLDRHETKFPLGGLSPDKEAVPADSVDEPRILEEPRIVEDPEKIPHSEKKPLP